jgi:type II secretory pathway component PulF
MSNDSPDREQHPFVADSGVVGHVAQVAAAGAPLSAGLLAYSREVPSWRQRGALRRISVRLSQGESLEQALNDEGAATPAYLRALVAAAQSCGRLAETLNRQLFAMRQTRDLRARVYLNLLYPALLCCLACIVVLLLLVWGVPIFRSIFIEFGVPLPSVTIQMIEASDALLTLFENWRWWILPGLAILGADYSVRWLPGHSLRTRLWQRIPLVGSPSRFAALSEFCSLLGLLASCRVPLPEALRLTSSALRDSSLAEGGRLLADQVERGLAADIEMQRMPHFPIALSTLFRWTDRPRAFADGLGAAAERYALQGRIHASVLNVVVQPLILAAVALFVGMFFLALLMPLIALLQSLM